MKGKSGLIHQEKVISFQEPHFDVVLPRAKLTRIRIRKKPKQGSPARLCLTDFLSPLLHIFVIPSDCYSRHHLPHFASSHWEAMWGSAQFCMGVLTGHLMHAAFDDERVLTLF